MSGYLLLFGGAQVGLAGSVNASSLPLINYIPLGDTWIFNLSSLQWTELTFAAGSAPSARANSAFGIVSSNPVVAYLFGGTDYLAGVADDLWQFSWASRQWLLLQEHVAVLGPRFHFQTAMIGIRIIIIGGSIYNSSIPFVSYDLESYETIPPDPGVFSITRDPASGQPVVETLNISGQAVPRSGGSLLTFEQADPTESLIGLTMGVSLDGPESSAVSFIKLTCNIGPSILALFLS